MPYVKENNCPWCNGIGIIYFHGHKPRVCFNCHGIKIIGDNRYAIGKYKFRLNKRD